MTPTFAIPFVFFYFVLEKISNANEDIVIQFVFYSNKQKKIVEIYKK